MSLSPYVYLSACRCHSRLGGLEVRDRTRIVLLIRLFHPFVELRALCMYGHLLQVPSQLTCANTARTRWLISGAYGDLYLPLGQRAFVCLTNAIR